MVVGSEASVVGLIFSSADERAAKKTTINFTLRVKGIKSNLNSQLYGFIHLDHDDVAPGSAVSQL